MPSLTELLASQKVKAGTAKETEKSNIPPTFAEPRLNRKRPWLQPNEGITADPPIPQKSLNQSIRPDHFTLKESLGKSSDTLQTGNKQTTNRLQTDHNEVTSEDLNGLQTDNKRVTTSLVVEDTVTRLKNERVTQQVTSEAPNRSQIDHKQVTNVAFERLKGLEAKFLRLVFQSCRSAGALLSPPITLEQIATHLNSAKSTSKTIIHRVVAKGFLIREMSETGRGGFTRFRISKELYQALVIFETDHKQITNGIQTDHKQITERITERVTSAPIVVVPNLNSSNTTNTQAAEEPCFVIPNELSGKVSRRQLSEFVLSGKISEADLQLSLDAFAYDLKNKLISVKHLTNPVGLLIGAIKNNGSYNSAKYVEVLKAELKPLIQAQREISAEKSELKNSAEWRSFQKFKSERPDAYRALQDKIAQYGFTGEMLEDFLFLEFKKTILKTEPEANLNPLRPHEARTP